MAKRGRHRRRVGGDGSTARSSPPGWVPGTSGLSRPAEAGPVAPVSRGEPDLVVDVRHLLRVGGPLDLLAAVSSMLSLVDPRAVDPFELLRHPPPAHGAPDELELETLLQSFVEARVPEATALLAGVAALAPDAEARARARAEVARRGHRLPPWVAGLAQARPYRAVLVSHVRGLADNVIVGVRLPPAHEITVSVYVDHDEGTVVSDCMILSARLDDVVGKLRRVVGGPDTTFAGLDLADARARLTQAIDNGAAAFPPVETEEWPLLRPLVEWVARRAAPGGADDP